MLRAVVFAAVISVAPVALAQQAQTDGAISTQAGGSKSMRDLLSEGYEIKTSVPSGTKFIVFMQKDKSAYACEFVSLTNSRCGSIN
ncbi:hypothetical protein [Neorhizobium galegae]|uniref:hypothetical protein n=1 Tax=Neorhizobium galegae TaxID=399 RepID=UPI00210322F8|nr:hypothetical protein [Neorhizobium galegae]MCQ1850350.1 hypothetical protein [Neorhizobium galegae]